MKRKLFLVGCCLLMFVPTLMAYSEHSAGIGDILLNDGKCVSVANLQQEQKAKAVAIVCGVNSQGKILGLGLKQSEETLTWANYGTIGNRTDFKDIICTPSATGSEATDNATFTGDKDGSDNWIEICKVDKNVASTNYPAFKWVNNYGTTYSLPKDYQDGWYMPSIAELTEICKNKEVINASLKKLGNTSLLKDVGYWSSSQSSTDNRYAWLILFGSGFIFDFGKESPLYVCCVRAF